MVKNILYISYIFFINIVLTSQDSAQFEDKYTYCGGRIYSDNDYLLLEQINFLCKEIKKDDRYLILFTNQNYNILEENENYINSCHSYYYKHCYINSAKCKNTFTICIFLYNEKVYINKGYNVNRAINEGEEEIIIKNALLYLQNNDYYNAVYYTFIEISRLFLKFYLESSKRKKRSLHFINKPYYILFIFLIVCLILCYLCYRKKQKEKEKMNYMESIERLNDIKYKNSDEQAGIIHNHIIYLKNLILEINKNISHSAFIDECLICMKRILYNREQNGNYECLHVYHKKCIKKYNLKFCLLCKDQNNNAYKYIEMSDSHTNIVTLLYIKNFLKNLIFIYPTDLLNIYAQKYNEEFNNTNYEIMDGKLSSFWNISSSVSTTYNNSGNNNKYIGLSNSSHENKGFKQTNIEMTDINNK